MKQQQQTIHNKLGYAATILTPKAYSLSVGWYDKKSLAIPSIASDDVQLVLAMTRFCTLHVVAGVTGD